MFDVAITLSLLVEIYDCHKPLEKIHVFSQNGFIPQMHTFSHCIHLRLVCRLDYKSKMPQNCEHFLKYSSIIPTYLRFIHTEIRRSHRRRLLLEDCSESKEDCSLSQVSFWIKKKLQKRCFSVNISKLAKTFFFYRAFLGDRSWQITIYIQWAKMQWRTNVIDQSLTCL